MTVDLLRTLDWSQNQDLRSYDHLHVETPNAVTARAYTPPPAVLDQGHLGGCVGFGTTAAVSSALLSNGDASAIDGRRIDTGPFARAVYELATTRDTIPGSWPTTGDTGSSVNAGMRAMRDLGVITAWHWSLTTASARHALLTRSPLVIGVPFYRSMFTLDPDGFMVVEPTSGLAGGHCMALLAYHADDVYDGRQSWGPTWGDHGNFRLRGSSLMRLLAQGAEIASFDLA